MKVFQGIVTSVKDAKTARVVVARTVKHPLYQKLIRRTQSFICENTANAEMNDTVSIRETRPLSARKRFEIISIEQKGATSDDAKKQIEEIKVLETEIMKATVSKTKKANIRVDKSEKADKEEKSEKAAEEVKKEKKESDQEQE